MDLQQEFDSVTTSLALVREKILLLSAEESKLLIKRAELEQQLYPKETEKKTKAVLELLRHKRTGL